MTAVIKFTIEESAVVQVSFPHAHCGATALYRAAYRFSTAEQWTQRRWNSSSVVLSLATNRMVTLEGHIECETSVEKFEPLKFHTGPPGELRLTPGRMQNL